METCKETLYSGSYQRSLEHSVILWAFISGFRLPERYDFQNEVSHDKIFEQAWDYLQENDSYLYEIEQDLDEVWHFTRIYIGNEWDIQSSYSKETEKRLCPEKTHNEQVKNIAVPQPFLV